MSFANDAYAFFAGAFQSQFPALRDMIASPGIRNPFYLLLLVSLLFWLLEAAVPWRKKQSLLRRDFWLDGFYMYFNLFIFPLLGFAAVASLIEFVLNRGFGMPADPGAGLLPIGNWPQAVQLIALFIIRDFIQWNVHRLLHRVPFLWEFHKVHHSVREMGFAAHLRYHWMENVVYSGIQYLPLRLLGFGFGDYFLVYSIALVIGHFNHANIKVPLGPLKYIFNNPQMHIWHHARHIPNRYGVNYGLSLSLWDYLFRTAYVPKDGRDEELGFENIERFPTGLFAQLLYPWSARQ